MELIKTILPVLTLILGFSLSEISKSFSNKREDKRKLKKVIFQLLELKWLIRTYTDLQIEVAQINQGILSKIPSPSKSLQKRINRQLTFYIDAQIVDPERFKRITEKLSETTNEISEVYPILAYVLSGHQDYFDFIPILEIESFEEDKIDSFPIEEIVNSDFDSEIITKEIDEHLQEISAKINSKTRKYTLEKINRLNQLKGALSKKEMDEIVQEMILNIN